MIDTAPDNEHRKITPPERNGISSFIPSITWLSSYQVGDLAQDLLSGLFLAVLLVPQAMAYALLAGLPPQVGLYASILPAVLYAFLGTSRYLSIGPSALVSLLVGEAVARASASTGVAPTEAALAMAVIVGITLFVMGILRLGFLVNFISDPVLVGFTSAAAILIATSQLRNLLGLDIPRGNFAETLRRLDNGIDQTNPVTLAIGLTALLLLLLAGRWLKGWLERTRIGERGRLFLVQAVPLLVVALSVATVWAFSLHERAGVAVVGKLEGGLPPLGLPPWDPQLWLSLLPSGLAISAIAFVTATAIAKSLAGRRRQHIEPSQEAIALGAANVAASLTGGYPVGASFSRSAMSFDTHAATPASSLVAALLVLVASLAFAPLFQFLPTTVLAALIIVAVFGLFNLDAMLRIWRYSRAEGISLLVTFLAVLFVGVDGGIALGALSGLALYLWRTSRPRIVIEGRLD
ncbi:MAG: SulP family inorganic anion transporter, partial [Chloroflexota bacterium]|nr:SulP family inorganic anion transporter [Chloroflexota bacterium]